MRQDCRRPHWLEAMRRLGYTHADLKIEDRDDDQMIRIMVDENALALRQARIVVRGKTEQLFDDF